MPKKRTHDEAIAVFEEAGYKVLLSTYLNKDSRFNYQCPSGHQHEMSFQNFFCGKRCPTCSRIKQVARQRTPIEDVKKYLESLGCTLLQEVYLNNRTPIKYLCPKEHVQKRPLDHVKSGSVCRECSNITLRKLFQTSYEEVKRQFDSAGYVLLTPESEYKNLSKQKLDFMCVDGHTGAMVGQNFLKGHRCKQCFYSVQGSEHPNWKPGKDPEERARGRQYRAYGRWRMDVFKRDDFTCKICEKRGGELEAHHLDSYADFPELRLSLSNGITLCKTCHKDFHLQFGNGGNTREQFERYRQKQESDRALGQAR